MSNLLKLLINNVMAPSLILGNFSGEFQKHIIEDDVAIIILTFQSSSRTM